MAKTRIFELARELDVRSKDILDKCRAEGVEVKNHMASISAGLEETIRDWFSEADADVEHTAVETTEHVDLKKAREEAKKSRVRREKKAKKKSEEEVSEEEVKEEETAEEQPVVLGLRACREPQEEGQ